MKVRVVIEYDIPAIDVLSDEDVRIIEATLSEQVPSVFESGDGCAMFADSWTVEVQR